MATVLVMAHQARAHPDLAETQRERAQLEAALAAKLAAAREPGGRPA
jgi:hypothetical protein